jgi:hypothetical protein
MSAENIRFISLLVAMVVLAAVNVAAAAFRVPGPTAAIGDALAAMSAMVGLLLGDKGKSPPPPT